MSYDKNKYDALRSSAVPHKMALALSQHALPNLGNPQIEGWVPIDQLPSNANQKANSDKINEIIEVLNEIMTHTVVEP